MSASTAVAMFQLSSDATEPRTIERIEHQAVFIQSRKEV